MKRSTIAVLLCGIAASAAVLLADVWFGGYKTGLQGVTTLPKGPLVLHNTETCAFKAIAFFSDTGASNVTGAASWSTNGGAGLTWDASSHTLSGDVSDASIYRSSVRAAYGGYTATVHVAVFDPAQVPDADADDISDAWEDTNGLSSADAGDALQCWYTNGFPRAALSNNLLLFVLGTTAPPRPEFPSTFWVYTASTNPASGGYWLDGDGDALPDGWELTYDATEGTNWFSYYGDRDCEGLTDFEEYVLGTNPTDKDTDDDSVNDYWDIEPHVLPAQNPQPVAVIRYPESGGEI